MGDDSAIVFSGIAPHPPIMVPEVGGSAVAEVRGSIDAMAEFAQRIIETGAETIVLISPHAPLDAQAFVAYHDTALYGDFSNFRSPETQLQFTLNKELLDSLEKTAAYHQFDVLKIERYDLDHGSAVPLYFLDRNGWRGRVVALGYSFLSNEDHMKFGGCIREAVDSLGEPVALVASGDLSHRLKRGAPAGFNPEAHRFDEEVVKAIDTHTPEEIAGIDHNLRRMAGECGYRSILIALGAGHDLPEACEVLNYEAPFGVGYLVAQLTNQKMTHSPETRLPSNETRVDVSDTDDPRLLPALARQAIENYVRTGKQIPAPTGSSELLSARAACFVSLRTRDGDLRGCIGTIEPVKPTLAEELITNAINSATRDPRFPPVSRLELPDLVYSVDVLASPEPASFDQLDPARYGVIVQDESGGNRGLLLPDIEGVKTAAQQVEIAASKAGIRPGTPLQLWRFRVDRYREK